MKKLYAYKIIFGIILLFGGLFSKITPVFAACTWDPSQNAIKIDNVPDNMLQHTLESRGYSGNVSYEIEKRIGDLLVVDSSEIFTIIDDDGRTLYKSSYRTGSIKLPQDPTYLSAQLGNGGYKVDVPNSQVDGLSRPLFLYKNPCGPLYPGEFSIGTKSDSIKSGDLELIEGQRRLNFHVPHTDLISSFEVYIEAVDSVLAQKSGYSIKKSTSNGILNISELEPVKDGDTSDPVEYKAIITFPCVNPKNLIDIDNDAVNNAKCTFRGGDNLTFIKDAVTEPKSDFDLVNESNNAVEACRGDLTCVNCVIRKEGGGTFGSYAEAAGVVYNSGDYVYTNNIYTAIGCVDTSQEGVVVRMIQIGLGVSGGIVLIKIGSAVGMLQSGNPSKIQEGKEIMTTAIVALLIIVFAGLGVRFLGINILGVLTPGTIETTDG